MSFAGNIIEFLPGNANVPSDPMEELLASGMVRNEDFVASGYQTHDQLVASGYTTIDEVRDDITASGFTTLDGVRTDLQASGYTTLGEVQDDLAASGFSTLTLEDVQNDLAGSGFTSLPDVLAEIGTSGYTTLSEVQSDIALSGFAQNRGLKTVTGAYSMTSSDGVVLANAAGGQFTVTLPSAVSASGLAYNIKRTNTGGNKVLVNSPDGIERSFINTLHLRRRGVAITVVSDGNMYHII